MAEFIRHEDRVHRIVYEVAMPASGEEVAKVLERMRDEFQRETGGSHQDFAECVRLDAKDGRLFLKIETAEIIP